MVNVGTDALTKSVSASFANTVGREPAQEFGWHKQVMAAIDDRTTECCLTACGQAVKVNAKFHLTAEPRFADEMDWVPFHWYCRSSVALYLPQYDDGLTEQLRERVAEERAKRAVIEAEKEVKREARAVRRAEREAAEAAEAAKKVDTSIIPGFTQEQSDAIHRGQARVRELYGGAGADLEVRAKKFQGETVGRYEFDHMAFDPDKLNERVWTDLRASNTARLNRSLDSWKETLQTELALGASEDSELVQKANRMIQQTTQRLEELGKAPPWTAIESFEDVIVHEYGHAIEFDWKFDRIPGETGQWLAPSEARLRDPDYVWENSLSYKVNIYANQEGNSISEYAMKNDSEYIAESFVRWSQGRKDEILQPDVLAFFERTLKK